MVCKPFPPGRSVVGVIPSQEAVRLVKQDFWEKEISNVDVTLFVVKFTGF